MTRFWGYSRRPSRGWQMLPDDGCNSGCWYRCPRPRPNWWARGGSWPTRKGGGGLGPRGRPGFFVLYHPFKNAVDVLVSLIVERTLVVVFFATFEKITAHDRFSCSQKLEISGTRGDPLPVADIVPESGEPAQPNGDFDSIPPPPPPVANKNGPATHPPPTRNP